VKTVIGILRVLVILILFLSLTTEVSAQFRNDSLQAITYDSIRSLYIKDFPNKFYIKPILTVRNLNLEFIDANKNADKITYLPSSSNYFGLGLYLFQIGVELSFKLPQDDVKKPAEKFGKTKAIDFQSNIYTKRWGADIAYQRYSGLYLDNPGSHLDNFQPGDNFPQRPDLTLRNFQLNTFYIFNHKKFSYRSAYNQADRQLKSAGSMLLGMFFSAYKYTSDSTLIPERDQAAYPNNENIRQGRIATIALFPGYTYTLTYHKFYLNTSLSIGPAHLWTKYNVDDFEKEDISIRPIYNIRAALGYNSDKFFGGITLVNQFVSAKIDNLEVNGAFGNVKIFLGLRFNEAGVLKKRFF
jgi:hypothetical protein